MPLSCETPVERRESRPSFVRRRRRGRPYPQPASSYTAWLIVTKPQHFRRANPHINRCRGPATHSTFHLFRILITLRFFLQNTNNEEGQKIPRKPNPRGKYSLMYNYFTMSTSTDASSSKQKKSQGLTSLQQDRQARNKDPFDSGSELKDRKKSG